ncbi:hypothetical protein XENTR_v10010571 [Xenopus tropicalis]|nr:hypothetical protein XENTR_v10010571 [Xenopus tropicalis]
MELPAQLCDFLTGITGGVGFSASRLYPTTASPCAPTGLEKRNHRGDGAAVNQWKRLCLNPFLLIRYLCSRDPRISLLIFFLSIFIYFYILFFCKKIIIV